MLPPFKVSFDVAYMAYVMLEANSFGNSLLLSCTFAGYKIFPSSTPIHLLAIGPIKLAFCIIASGLGIALPS